MVSITSDTPTTVIKLFNSITFTFKNVSYCFKLSKFPPVLVLIYKKKEKKGKDYIPVNILSSVSKIHEGYLQGQSNEYFTNFII